MKTLLTLIFLCFISTLTFANNIFATNSHLNSLVNKNDVPEIQNNRIEMVLINYDLKPTTCVATFTINIIDSETGRKVGTITRTATFTSETSWGTCDVAMAMAEQMAKDALNTIMGES